MSTGPRLLIAAVIIVAVIVGLVVVRLNHNEEFTPPISSPPEQNPDNPPSGLRLPFKISDINENRGEINPLGVVRFSKDQGEFGHSGIDFPLFQGSSIHAVADGEIIIIKSASDPWGGQGMFQLLEPTLPGEGWAYVYEHVTPAEGIAPGSQVKAGDVIATKTPPEGFTAHFQLSYVFNNYQFTRGMECWVDLLGRADQAALEDWWTARVTSGKVGVNWNSIREEGAYPFRGLLDKSEFPNGPQLCYAPGTDAR